MNDYSEVKIKNKKVYLHISLVEGTYPKDQIDEMILNQEKVFVSYLGLLITHENLTYNHQKDIAIILLGVINGGKFVFDKSHNFEVIDIYPINTNDIVEVLRWMFSKIGSTNAKVYKKYLQYHKPSDARPFDPFDKNKFIQFSKLITKNSFRNESIFKSIESKLRESLDEPNIWNQKFEETDRKFRKEVKLHKAIENASNFNLTRTKFLEDIRSDLIKLINSDAIEDDFQDWMLIAIKIIWPNYIHVIPNFTYNSTLEGIKTRNEIDFVCIDINFKVDLIEIKRSKAVKLLGKQYRSKIFPLSTEMNNEISQLNHNIQRFKNLSDSNRKRIKTATGIKSSELHFETTRGILVSGLDRTMNNVFIPQLSSDGQLKGCPYTFSV